MSDRAEITAKATKQVSARMIQEAPKKESGYTRLSAKREGKTRMNIGQSEARNMRVRTRDGMAENRGERARSILSFPENRLKSPVMSALMNTSIKIVSMKSSERYRKIASLKYPERERNRKPWRKNEKRATESERSSKRKRPAVVILAVRFCEKY